MEESTVGKIRSVLIERGEKLLAEPRRKVEFTPKADADELLNDLEKYPHAFVLACLMDRQIRAEKAWVIPYEVSLEIDGFSFQSLLRLSRDRITQIFDKKRLHRFNDTMSEVFHLGVKRIHTQYHDDASAIWRSTPASATVAGDSWSLKEQGLRLLQWQLTSWQEPLRFRWQTSSPSIFRRMFR